MPPVVRVEKVIVAGLPVNVYTKSTPASDLTGDVAVLFFLHGRGGAAAEVEVQITELFRTLGDHWAHLQADKELVVATIDQRNHGERLVHAKGNIAWKDGNDRHAVDMYAMQTGTSRDVSFLIDFLPSYLFPAGDAQVVQWLVGGISLGGHATWISLHHDPRISVGIPIIGCPDFIKLMSGRAKETGVPFGPPYIPEDLLALVKRHDPAQAAYTASDASNPFLGKKILVLSGAADPLVSWSCSEEFVNMLNVGSTGVKKVIAYPGVGHTCTTEMVQEMARFLWEHVLSQAAAARN